MAQHDYVIANQSGAAFRADLNNALAAVVSQNSGAAEPSVTYAYMPWADTTNGLFKIRNAANSGWITLYQLDGEWSTIALEDGTAAAPSLYFKDSGTDTGAYSPGADQFAIATGGVQRVNFNGSTEVVFNDGGADVDFRIEGDTKADLFKVDAGTDAVSIDGAFSVTGNATVESLNGGPLAGTRNRIINGDMRIDQRNDGAAVSISTLTYTADRWSVATNGAAVTVQRLGTAAEYYLNVTGAASVTACNIRHRIESKNIADLAGSTVTLSFKCSSSSLTSLDFALVYADSVDNFATGTLISSVNISITSTPTIYSTSFSLPANAANGVQVLFSLGAFTSGTFTLTDVQLEVGSVATPFEHRSYGQELALCQRYYQGGSGIVFQAVASAGGYDTPATFTLPVTMRASPTVSVSGTKGAYTGTTTLSSSFPHGFVVTMQSANGNGPRGFTNMTYTANIEL